MTELQPCPICNRKAKLQILGSRIWIECANTPFGLLMKDHSIVLRNQHTETQEQLIERWNDLPRRLVEREPSKSLKELNVLAKFVIDEFEKVFGRAFHYEITKHLSHTLNINRLIIFFTEDEINKTPSFFQKVHEAIHAAHEAHQELAGVFAFGFNS